MAEFLDVTHSSRVCLDFKNERTVFEYMLAVISALLIHSNKSVSSAKKCLVNRVR